MIRIHTCPLPSSWCPACGKVIKAAERLGVPYERKKVWQFPRSRRKEVIALSGQQYVPILVEEDGQVLHESDVLVAHLERTHGTQGES